MDRLRAFQVEALSEALEQLLACLQQAVHAGEPRWVALTVFARDRAAALFIDHSREAVGDVMSGDAGDIYKATLVDARLVDMLFMLPPAPHHLRARWMQLPPEDERRLYAGLVLFLPQDFDGLSAIIGVEAWADLLPQYLTWQPKCFVTEHQRSRYYEHVTSLCNACADLFDRGPCASQQHLLGAIVGTLRSGAIYSCEGYLLEFAKAKSRLIRAFVAFKFGLSPPSARATEPVAADRPIRLALLWNDIDRRTENIVGVASARSLRSHGFHVTSILHHRSYHGETQDPSSTIAEALSGLSDEIVDLDAVKTLSDKYEAIKALDLDCLIFMNNVTFGYNEYVALATLKLARWQAVNFCAVFTTGFPAVDLYLSGEISERGADPQDGYTERLVRLPGTCLIFDNDEGRKTEVPSRGLAERMRDRGTATLFASGANFYKIHPELSETWARVLAASPGSRLVLYPFNPNWDLNYPVETFRRRFETQLAAHGVDPGRITVAGPWRDAEAVGELLNSVDIYLDSFPHSGGLSSLDALRLGIPIVTLQGITQRENQSADLLELMGLSRFIVATKQDYVALAARLARDPSAWAEYKIAIARTIGRAEFFDTDRYSRVFAEKLRELLLAA